jgi:hypothetical protein
MKSRLFKTRAQVEAFAACLENEGGVLNVLVKKDDTIP